MSRNELIAKIEALNEWEAMMEEVCQCLYMTATTAV